MSATRAASLVISDGALPALRSTLAAALKLDKKADVLLFGNEAAVRAKEASQMDGVSRVYVAENPKPVTVELAADIVKREVEEGGYVNVMASAGTFGKNLIPRVAGSMGLSCLSEIMNIEGDEFVRPIYAGNALQRVKSLEQVKMMTVRATAFDGVGDAEQQAEIVSVGSVEGGAGSRWVGMESSGDVDLGSAKVVVAGGRGVGKEGFGVLRELAGVLGGVVGASRAAVDNEWVPNDLQVGQTGKIVKADLYFAVGISGAIQHVAGMRECKCVVAVNRDKEAPIFEVADYGVVGDFKEVLPQILDKVRQVKQA